MTDLLWVLGVPQSLGVRQRLAGEKCFVQPNVIYLPKFPSASLDTLLELSEEVGRIHSQIETMCKKFEYDVIECFDKSILLSIDDTPPADYLRNFTWSEMDFSLQRASLHDIIAEIHRSAILAERGFRERQNHYNSAKTALSNAKRASEGPLQTRNLDTLIHSNDDCWFESAHMTTLICVVSRYSLDSFYKTYATVSPYVVPDSAYLVTQDENNVLLTIIVMRDKMVEISGLLRKEKIIVREYTPKECREEADSVNMLNHLSDVVEEARGQLEEAARHIYPLLFKALCYITFMKAYIDCILKYGLSSDDGLLFDVIVVGVADKEERNAKALIEKDILKSLYTQGATVLGHEAQIYDHMENVDSFLPFAFIPLHIQRK